MTLRRLSMLQWFGFGGAALAWAAQHVIGFGVTQAECSAGGLHWRIDNNVWQLTLLAVAGLVVVAAEAAAVVVFVRTRDTDEDDPAPLGRMHFLASAAVVANLLFLSAMLMDGVASTMGTICRGG
jgi:hypothetical protein